MAERALEDGHRISLGLRQPGDLQGTKLDPTLVGADRVQLVPYDAKDPDAAVRWVAAATNHFAGFDSLIHCAGILRPTPLLFSEQQRDEPEELWRVNVMGPWWLTRAAWPQLVAHGDGRIQVLVSMSGKRSKGRWAGYASSKFALMGLCQTMRNEGWEFGIRVTAICPGWVETDMAREGMELMAKGLGISYQEAREQALSQVPIQRIIEPEEVAALVVYMAGPEAGGMTAQAVSLCGGATML